MENTALMKSIKYVSGILYNMTDICNIFNLEMNKIIEVIKNNDISYLIDSKNNIYINKEGICKIFTLINAIETINHQEFSNFFYCIRCDAFGENQCDRINKRILLYM